MEWLARVDPVTYGVDPLRQVVLRESVSSSALEMLRLYPITTDVLIMIGFGALFIVPAVWLFNRQD
jgi:ABC-type transport system involved in multi-copper enzyme maturation permease subunit